MRALKITGIILIVVLSVGMLAACTLSNDKNESAGDADLTDMVGRLCEDADVPNYEILTLDENTFENYTFIPYEDGLTAVSADALVNITPHSLVVIHSDQGEASTFAEEIYQNADPNKWLCVGSERLCVANTDHYIVLVMSEEDICDDIIDNFKDIAESLGDGEIELMTADNSIRYS